MIISNLHSATHIALVSSRNERLASHWKLNIDNTDLLYNVSPKAGTIISVFLKLQSFTF